MKTGFEKLDKIIEVNKGDLIIVASRPSMGKTSLVCNMVNYVLTKEKEAVLFFELEESIEKIEERLRLVNENIETEDLPIYILDDYRCRHMCSKSEILKKEKNIKLIIIDYFQLIEIDKGVLSNREYECIEILRKLKLLAKELNIPIIVTSTVSSKCERDKSRNDKRPLMEDIVSPKIGIDNYVDKVLFMYRDSYYNKNNKSNLTEIIVAKNENGKTGTVKLEWIPEKLMFINTTVTEKEMSNNEESN